MRSPEGVKVVAVTLLGLNAYLKDATLRTLAPCSQSIRLGPQSADLAISLPFFVQGASAFSLA
ncbi:hypothetical protein [Paraburkholderia terrae]|uniref:hypothetical protein n=1 Tax=Paraburkholderia terrae TaxID=311230 RepID=UPI00204E52FA|nr:hypothetical protein [Paraburkholderia terrae]BDC42895.1 hypothetical protein PTKU15_61920 [Paraburkholderia terrae]